MTPEKKLLELERTYWKAIKDRDIDVLLSMTEDPCIVTGPQGVERIDHQTYAGMMKSSSWTLEDFELKDALVQMVAPDVAIVAYTVKESLTVDGKALTLEAADSSTWVRRDGRWVCTLHSEAIAGDPFGRDRKAAA